MDSVARGTRGEELTSTSGITPRTQEPSPSPEESKKDSPSSATITCTQTSMTNAPAPIRTSKDVRIHQLAPLAWNLSDSPLSSPLSENTVFPWQKGLREETPTSPFSYRPWERTCSKDTVYRYHTKRTCTAIDHHRTGTVDAPVLPLCSLATSLVPVPGN